MDAIELFKKTEAGFDATGVFYCGKCRIVARDQETAEACCKPMLCSCGELVRGRFHALCEACENKRIKDTQANIMAKAEKVESWDGWVYDPESEEYYEDIDALLEKYQDEDWTLPEFVYLTSELKFEVDLRSAIESALENHHEEAGECITGQEEIEKAVAEWCAKQEIISYEIDYKRALRVPREDANLSETPKTSPLTVRHTSRMVYQAPNE